MGILEDFPAISLIPYKGIFRPPQPQIDPQISPLRPEIGPPRPDIGLHGPKIDPSYKLSQAFNQSHKGNMWSAIPVALQCLAVCLSKGKQGSGPEGH